MPSPMLRVTVDPTGCERPMLHLDAPNDGKCLECGRPTENPKFCGRACAARHNNRKNPKRRSEEKCAECGSPVPAAKRVCLGCQRRSREQAESTRTWRSPGGEIVQRQVASVNVTSRVVFDISGPGIQRFPLASRSGPFLEALLGLCYTDPPYVRAQDAPRYASLLDSLMTFRLSDARWNDNAAPVAVQDVPLSYLGLAIRCWIRSFFGEEHHPLMASYALDTACFIDAHAGGKYFSGRKSMPAEIPPMVEVRDRPIVNCVNDPKFKKEMTDGNIGGVVVLAEIKGSVAELLGPGAKCYLQVQRCHLSTKWDDYHAILAKDDEPKEYDIAEALWFQGRMLMRGTNPPLSAREASFHDCIAASPSECEHEGVQIVFPVRWITHAVREQPDQNYELLPVPKWQ